MQEWQDRHDPRQIRLPLRPQHRGHLSLIHISDEGKQVIAIYSHNGYQKAQSSDYDNERAAQKLIQELTAAN